MTRLFCSAVALAATVLAYSSSGASAFSPLPASKATTISLSAFASTTVAPPPSREKTDQDTGYDDLGDISENYEDLEDEVRRSGPLEYLEDDPDLSRELDDPFHILLLGSTFDKPKITVDYVVGTLNYVLEMPELEAKELAQFSYEHGMSCLGTWSRQECLSLGRELQVRDVVCRVVPFCEGGQRGWQAKDSTTGAGAGLQRF